MTFSHYAGTAIVPTLSRIILCAAFLPQGWIKCFTDARFDPAENQHLQALNVKTSPWIEPTPKSSSTAPDSTAGTDDANSPAQASDPEDQSTDTNADSPASGPVFVSAPPPTAYAAPAMHKVTLQLESHGWPYPNWLALVAAATELVGGALLLIGFLSRVWGLGLAIAMGVAFYLVTIQANQVFQMQPLDVASDPQKFQTMFLQLGLFLLAFGVFLTGPGPLSLDRWLFADDPELGAGEQDLDSPHGDDDDDDSLPLSPPPRPI